MKWSMDKEREIKVVIYMFGITLTPNKEKYVMNPIDHLMYYAIDRLNNLSLSDNQTYWHNYSGCTALHLAAKAASVFIIKRLCDVGFDINIQDDNSYTPLMYAIMYHANNALKELIEQGADINICSRYDGDGMSIAKLSKNNYAIELLNDIGSL